eukprot:25547-Rhodomonas_salina.1
MLSGGRSKYRTSCSKYRTCTEHVVVSTGHSTRLAVVSVGRERSAYDDLRAEGGLEERRERAHRRSAFPVQRVRGTRLNAFDSATK